MYRLILLLFTILLSLGACSRSKVNLSSQFQKDSLRSLAVLPIDYPSDIQREKVDSIKTAIESELKNRGFVVLADSLVRQNCSSPACPEKFELAEKYLVDGLVRVDVRSVQRANFLAGYVNTIGGTITIFDKNNTELLSVDHSENERGGLVFNSGQIIQGLIETSENTEEKSFARLSARFANNLISKIPRPDVAQVNRDAVAVNIVDVKVKEVRPQIFEVCAEATPNSIVSLIVNRQRSNLREIKEAQYCGTYFLDPSLQNSSTLKVEARSAFGTAVQKEFPSGTSSTTCRLEDNVFVKNVNGKSRLEVSCTDLGDGKSPIIGDCKEAVVKCPDYKFIVFKAPTAIGPFERIAEVRSTSWTDSKAKTAASTTYELVPVNKAGVWSLPVTAKPVS